MKPAGHNPVAVYREAISLHGTGSVSANTVRDIYNEFDVKAEAIQQATDEATVLEGENPNANVFYDTNVIIDPEIESDLRADAETNVVNAEDISFTIPAAIIQLADSGAEIFISSEDYTVTIGRRKRF